MLAFKMFYINFAVAEVLIVGGEYNPYIINNSGRVEGVFPEIVRAVFQEFDIDVKFSLMPWKRCEKFIREGRAFAAIPYLHTESRAELFDFSDPVISFYPKFFYKKQAFPNGFEWNSLTDFKPYIIGGVTGYWYEGTFQEKELDVQYVANDKINIKKLMQNRIDFTLIDESVGWYLVNELFPFQDQMDAFAVTKKAESSDAFHLMISRTYQNSKELKQAFNKGLKVIQNNATYHEIIQRYKMSQDYMLH